MADETRTRLNRPPADPPARETSEKGSPALAKPGKPKWTPFIDKESLPKDVVIDKKGKVKRPGTVHYATLTSVTGTVKLVGYFRNGKGIGRRLVKLLKPQKKNSRGARDRAILKELRASGVQDIAVY